MSVVIAPQASVSYTATAALNTHKLRTAAWDDGSISTATRAFDPSGAPRACYLADAITLQSKECATIDGIGLVVQALRF